MTRAIYKSLLQACGVFALVLAGNSFGQTMDAAQKERCATRVSIALTGKSADAGLLAAADPRAEAMRLMGTADFRDRFARFMNTRMNENPGANAPEDASYFLTDYILANNKPWKELFTGPYMVEAVAQGNNPTANARVVVNQEGLGYFRSPIWLLRYAGNEETGLKLNTAYRIMNNVIGLTLKAAVNNTSDDVSANGRAQLPCKTCHFDGPFPLDTISHILTKKIVNPADPNDIRFGPQQAPSVTVLGGKTITNDKDLVTALVESDSFNYNVCRSAFDFLYGRSEYTCDAATFDKCIQDFKASGQIQSALNAIIQSKDFCN